jgi:AcrR family transcriptional regulator
MSPRPYRSFRRRLAAERTRARLLKAATATLAAGEVFSLDAVAKRAGVTRLTVYNQFGSRRALLEAAFDNMAERGGLHRIGEAMTNTDPQAALQQIVAIFCNFWSAYHGAVWRLRAASATDPEFEESLRARDDRRRHLLSVLCDRMMKGRHKRPAVVAELVDVLFALTSVAFFSEFTAGGHSKKAACRLIQALATDAVRRTLADTE